MVTYCVLTYCVLTYCIDADAEIVFVNYLLMSVHSWHMTMNANMQPAEM